MKPSISIEYSSPMVQGNHPHARVAIMGMPHPTSVGGLIGQLKSEITTLKKQLKQFDWMLAQKDIDSQHLKTELACALQHLQKLEHERKRTTPKKTLWTSLRAWAGYWSKYKH